MKKTSKSSPLHTPPKFHRVIGNKLYSLTSEGKQGEYHQTIIDENADGYFYINSQGNPDLAYGTTVNFIGKQRVEVKND